MFNFLFSAEERITGEVEILLGGDKNRTSKNTEITKEMENEFRVTPYGGLSIWWKK